MTGFSDAHHFRKMVAGICMVFAPLALLGAMITESRIGLHENAFVIGKVGNPDTGSLEQMLLVAGLVLMVPATLGFMHMLREHEVEIGHLGGAIALLGLLVLPWAFMAGMFVLAYGLYAAKVVQPVMAGFIALAAAGLAIGALGESELFAFAGAALMLIGMGSVGRTVLEESDADWEHTPVVAH